MKKLLWVDIETTGLIPEKGDILEICMVVTDLELNVIDYETSIIKSSSIFKSKCDDFVTIMHTQNGLFKEIDEANEVIDYNFVEDLFILFVTEHFGTEKPELHGNTVHFDKKWIEYHMPKLGKLFNYRIVDVFSFKTVFKNYMPLTHRYIEDHKNKVSRHRAHDDILGSIKEMKEYLRILGIFSMYEFQVKGRDF